MATPTVTIKGGDKLSKVLYQIGERAKGGIVKVGFLEGATYSNAARSRLKGKRVKNRKKLEKIAAGPTLNVAQVAFWNEFGTTNSPPRPYFRNTIKEKSPQWGEEMAKIFKAAKYSGPLTLQRMGTRIKDQITKAIAGWPADNADRTVKAKGFNHGLLDTGIMQRSVDYEVET